MVIFKFFAGIAPAPYRAYIGYNPQGRPLLVLVRYVPGRKERLHAVRDPMANVLAAVMERYPKLIDKDLTTLFIQLWPEPIDDREQFIFEI